jgi:hypothetical protein
MTPDYQGSKQHETLGEFIAPSLGYFGGKMLNAGKGLPVGLSIQDVTPKIEPAKVAEALRQPEKNALGFYSPLEEAVYGLKNEKGTGQQYLAQLLKTGGVKPEEVTTRGLDTFLGENPKVTKEQLINYLRENPVELSETIKTSDTPNNLNTMSYEDYRLNEGQPIDDPDYINSRASDIFHEDYKNNVEIRQETADDLVRQNPEKYADWETNDSIHERLMRDVDSELESIAYDRAKEEYWDNPYSEYNDELGYRVIGNDDVGYHITDPNGRVLDYRNGIYDIDEVESAIRDDALEQGYLSYGDDEYGTKYHDYTLPNGENYREVLIQYPQKPALVKEMSNGQGWMAQGSEGSEPIYGKTREEAIERWQDSRHAKNYQSGHFDEPNILAHFRTTDRTIDGKKTLFVEEIQSDWHQQGRKKGYNEPKALAEIQKQRQILLDKKDYYAKLAEPYAEQGKDAPPEVVEGWTLAANGLQELDKKQSALGRAVPDAPFKKNWQELAMKRAMQMAAEGGYDRVAFTTGKQQSERYNLSKQVEKINWMPYESNGSTESCPNSAQ